MCVEDACMSAVIVDHERLRILLEDHAAFFCCHAAVEVRNAALAGVGCARTCARQRTCADVLAVLVVTHIARFIHPLRTVLQIEVRCAAVVHETVEACICRRKGDAERPCRESKEIAVEDNALCSRRHPIGTGIHMDCALIGRQCIVAVFHAGRYLDAAAAEVHAAAVGVRRDAVAVDGHIYGPADGDVALFDLC